jgi:hypothetical protein
MWEKRPKRQNAEYHREEHEQFDFNHVVINAEAVSEAI